MEDRVIREEGRLRLEETPALQFMAELLSELRALELPWWTPEQLRQALGVGARMRFLAERPDLRARITTDLTGLSPKVARTQSPEVQAGLIDAALDAGELSARRLEEAFAPEDIAAYGPAAELWRLFCARMPWDQDVPVHRELMAFVIDALLKPRGGPAGERSVLRPLDVRAAIPHEVYFARLPVEVHAAIARARLELERTRPEAPFHAEHELAIAMPAILTHHLPLRAFTGLGPVVERALAASVAGLGLAPGGSWREGEATLLDESEGSATRKAPTDPPASAERPRSVGRAAGPPASEPRSRVGFVRPPPLPGPPPLPMSADELLREDDTVFDVSLADLEDPRRPTDPPRAAAVPPLPRRWRS